MSAKRNTPAGRKALANRIRIPPPRPPKRPAKQRGDWLSKALQPEAK